MLLIVTGMQREARLAEGPDNRIVLSGGDPAALAGRLARLRDEPFTAILSFGVAGGLRAGLAPGHVVIASAVTAGRKAVSADPKLAAALVAELRGAELLGAGLSVSLGPVAGSDTPVLGVAGKAALAAATGALAVDMESHVAASYAARRRLPFMAVRAICDPAGRAVPGFAAAALKPDGGTNIAAILVGLAARPGALPGLLRLGRDARAAFAALGRCGDLLGVRRGCPDLVELLGDVA